MVRLIFVVVSVLLALVFSLGNFQRLFLVGLVGDDDLGGVRPGVVVVVVVLQVADGVDAGGPAVAHVVDVVAAVTTDVVDVGSALMVLAVGRQTVRVDVAAVDQLFLFLKKFQHLRIVKFHQFRCLL